jgi:thiamine pyrophosphate-dependent acetolactate synthase large subunit-like protein
VATELGRIDFAAVAEACGAQALRVRHDDEVDGALAQAFEAPGVTLVHAHLDPSFLSVDRRLEA